MGIAPPTCTQREAATAYLRAYVVIAFQGHGQKLQEMINIFGGFELKASNSHCKFPTF